MRFGYVPTPHCIWRGARKLAPGTFLTLRQERAPETAPFWSLAECDSSVADMTDVEAVEALDALLRDAVRRQMVADVPLGAFLSDRKSTRLNSSPSCASRMPSSA